MQIISVRRFQQWLATQKDIHAFESRSWSADNTKNLEIFAAKLDIHRSQSVPVVSVLVLCHGHAHRGDWRSYVTLSDDYQYESLLVDYNPKSQPDIVLDIVQAADKLTQACNSLGIQFNAVVFAGVTSMITARQNMWRALAPCLSDKLVVAGCGTDDRSGFSLCRGSIREALHPKEVEFTSRIHTPRKSRPASPVRLPFRFKRDVAEIKEEKGAEVSKAVLSTAVDDLKRQVSNLFEIVTQQAAMIAELQEKVVGSVEPRRDESERGEPA